MHGARLPSVYSGAQFHERKPFDSLAEQRVVRA